MKMLGIPSIKSEVYDVFVLDITNPYSPLCLASSNIELSFLPSKVESLPHVTKIIYS